MNDVKLLLQGSINEFADKVKNVTVTPCSYFIGINGLAYILRGDETKKISASLHTTVTEAQHTEGILSLADVLISTQADIFSLFQEASPVYILNYKDIDMCVYRSSDFNAIAGTYHYTAEIIQNRNKNFIVLDESLATQMFFSNSTVKWLEFGNKYGYDIYPAFLTPRNLENEYFTVEIKQSTKGTAFKRDNDNKLYQNISDSVRLVLTNGTLDKSQKFAYDLYCQAEEYKLFGLLDLPQWQQSHYETQSGFGLKSNIQYMELKINYNTASNIDEALKYIRHCTPNIQILN